MKKYLYLLFAAIFASMSLTLVSCGDDDDEPSNSNGNIIGSWKVETLKIDNDLWQVDYVRFNEDGTYTSVAVGCSFGENYAIKDGGTWSKKDNSLTMDGLTASIKELNNKRMVLNLRGVDFIYYKCTDAEMDLYL